MSKHTNARFYAALAVFSLIGQVAWVIENMYFNVFIYNMFHATADDISLMVLASAVSAAVTTIFVGALADKIGKRKPFICIGYILWGISILSFSLLRVDILSMYVTGVSAAMSLGVTLTVIMDCVMTFFGSSANDACFNAWLTDSTDETNRGTAEGINSMMPLIAILVVFGGFMAFDLSSPESWTAIYIIIGAAVILIGILGLFIIKEPDIKPIKQKYFSTVIYSFRPSVVKNNKMFYMALAAFSVFNISIQIFMPYLILYYTEALHMSNYVLIMAPAIIFASAATVFFGKRYDRVKFVKSIPFSLAFLAAGYIVLSIFTSVPAVFIGSLLMMTGYLSGCAIFGAVIREYTPAGMSGQFQGVRIVCQVLIPGAIGPIIGAAVLSGAEQVANSDGTYSFIPNRGIFIAALAVTVLLVGVLVPFIHMLKNKKTDIEKEQCS